jgi:hypothetical protein
MSDELRDRIAYELAGHQIGLGYQGAFVDMEEAREMAQAVIDDLGLVVERTVRVVDHGAGEVRIPETRVVGKWER